MATLTQYSSPGQYRSASFLSAGGLSQPGSAPYGVGPTGTMGGTFPVSVPGGTLNIGIGAIETELARYTGLGMAGGRPVDTGSGNGQPRDADTTVAWQGPIQPEKKSGGMTVLILAAVALLALGSTRRRRK